MSPRPVTVRLLDPRIHEFLPTERQQVDKLKHLRDTVLDMNVLSDTIEFMYRTSDVHPQATHLADLLLMDEPIQRKHSMLQKVRALSEVNPMLG